MSVTEFAAAVLGLGQQVLQQSQGGEQPTVCFAAVPLLIPPAIIAARSVLRTLRSRSASA
jgi:hypothetical protein